MKVQKQLTYIANVRLPTEKAHGIQIVKMCEAFAQQGLAVTLMYPKRSQSNSALKDRNIYDYYSVETSFSLQPTWNLDLIAISDLSKKFFAYALQDLSFAIAAVIKSFKAPLVYTRSKWAALFHGVLQKPVFFESHDRAKSLLDKILAKKVKAVIVISKSIEQSWQQIKASTVYAPDGVGREFFLKTTKIASRRTINIPNKQKIVVYAGNLYPWKGVGNLLAAAQNLPGIHFYFVGGSPADDNIAPLLEKYGNYPNIHIIGHRPYQEIPRWLKAADVLVIPNSAINRKGSEDTSPLKLFEYLASGTTIVASKVPALTEIVTEKEVRWSNPDDADDLTRSIIDSLEHPSVDARHNRRKALQYTWKKRAQKIVNKVFLNA